MFKLVVFDLDGTLLNSIEDIADSCNQMFTELRFPTMSLKDITEIVGHGVENMIDRTVKSDDKELKARALSIYRDKYEKNKFNKTRPYDGVIDLLYKLKKEGIKIAVLSNKKDVFTKEMVERFFPNTFDFVLGSTDDFPLKPDPSSLVMIMDKFSSDKSQTSFIGDSEADVHTAINANLAPVAVSWGFRTEDQLTESGSDYNIKDCEALYKYLTN